MATQWTANQAAAIAAAGNNVIVPAAAGSGKTAVLVQRVIDTVIHQQVDITQLLIVTFTKAAASNMRTRIHAALTEALTREPHNTHVARQLTLLDAAHISTVHAYCQHLIGNHLTELNLPSQYSIADEADTLFYKRQAVTQTFEHHYANGGEAFAYLCDAYGGKADKGALVDTVLRLYEFTRSLLDPDGYLSQCVDLYGGDVALWRDTVLEYARESLDAAACYVDLALECALSDGEQSTRADVLSREKEDLLSMLCMGWDALRDALRGMTWAMLPRKNKRMDAELAERCKAYRDEAKACVKWADEVCDADLQTLRDESRRQQPLMACLAELVRDVDERYAALKYANKLLDFSDIEHHTLRLLGDEALAARLRGGFHEILVDEYQDTNEIQSAIFHALSDGHNLFTVGDVKQSIYRFRHAMPVLFTRMRRRYDENPSDGVVIPLSHNFRSYGRVIDYINRVFLRIMRNELGDVDYTREQLIGARNDMVVATTPIELHILADTAVSEEEEEVEEDTSAIEKQCYLAARRIRELVDDDTATLDGRRIGYGDFAILSHNAKAADVAIGVLAQAGIPYVTQSESGYFEYNEVRVLLCLLEVIDNPLQDIPLIALLRSPIFGFADSKLASIRDGGGTYYDMLCRAADNGDTLCVDAVERIRRYTVHAHTYGIAATVRRCVKDCNLHSAVALLPSGDERIRNIELLCDMASQFEAGGYKSINDFVSYINNLRESATFTRVRSTGDDAVTVTTIHRSKGMEYGIVILIDTQRRYNMADLNNPIIFHPHVGVGIKYVDTARGIRYNSLAYNAARLTVRRELLSESVRVLYVALTRAIYKLIIVGSVKDVERSRDRWAELRDLTDGTALAAHTLKGCQCYLDLLLSCGEHCVTFHEMRDIEPPQRAESVDRIVADVQDPLDMDEVYAGLSYVYPYDAARFVPSKIAVSEAIGGRDETEELLPLTTQRQTRTDSAVRGSVIHYVMQTLDLTNIADADAIGAQIDGMVADGAVPSMYRDSIDAGRIHEFLHSELGQRMIHAAAIEREFRFVLEVEADSVRSDLPDDAAYEHVLLQGVVDCFFMEGDKAVVIDYKTGKVDADKHTRQLALYTRALKQLYRVDVGEMHIVQL